MIIAKCNTKLRLSDLINTHPLPFSACLSSSLGIRKPISFSLSFLLGPLTTLRYSSSCWLIPPPSGIHNPKLCLYHLFSLFDHSLSNFSPSLQVFPFLLILMFYYFHQPTNSTILQLDDLASVWFDNIFHTKDRIRMKVCSSNFSIYLTMSCSNLNIVYNFWIDV